MNVTEERPGSVAVTRYVPGVAGVVNTVALPPVETARDCGARLLSEGRTASYLGLDLESFRTRLAALRSAGFPGPEPITGSYDRAAIDRWLDQRADRN